MKRECGSCQHLFSDKDFKQNKQRNYLGIFLGRFPKVDGRKKAAYETYLNFVPFLLVSSCRQANLLPTLALPPAAHTLLASLRKLPSFFFGVTHFSGPAIGLWSFKFDLGWIFL